MFGQRIKMLREANSLTQKQVATALGIDRSSYSYYESGKSQPNIDGLKILARLYDVSIDFLLDFNSGKSRKELDSGCDPYKLYSPKLSYNSQGNKPSYISDLTEDEKNIIIAYRTADENIKYKFQKLSKQTMKNKND